MPAPLFALFFLTEPEAFLLCLPFLGGPAGLPLQTNGLPLTGEGLLGFGTQSLWLGGFGGFPLHPLWISQGRPGGCLW